ncbi:MAG: sigma-70 family RNA polymerase sigma factor [Prevotellaceae bacterium]|jgi:RNA polymerase sigma-70 factor (ECF subfamily)|nr:sigma-70 family RNA polymerase sigma factor [Prevotellaceae bacterium]
MEERLLIEGCKKGESWAQKLMYELYAPVMMGVCLRYVGNRQTACDLMHDGFVKLFSKIDTYSGTGSFKGWMRKIFVNTALEHLRHKDVLRGSVEIEKSDHECVEPDVSLFEPLSAECLFACITQLPNKYRVVFNLRAIEKYSYHEIVKELKISENTVRSQYARARQLLQKMLMDKIDNSDERRF